LQIIEAVVKEVRARGFFEPLRGLAAFMLFGK
jgi:hypothetical protein